jgi:3-isopropylmalate dehydrogenase
VRILSLPGDGIGPEVCEQAEKVLRCIAERGGHSLDITHDLIGAAALKATGRALPDSARAAAVGADAVLLGAVGLPEFDQLPPAQRPEKGLLELREAMGVYANLRPVKAQDCLLGASPLKPERVRGTDLLIVRELTGGLYFGQPRGLEGKGDGRRAVNTMAYTAPEIQRIAVLAFELAAARRGRLTSVDKANVLENSRLWRTVVEEIATGYPAVKLDHLLVDNAAMQLVLDPSGFDVLLTENLFGDILSDEAAVIAGSIGLLPSASLGPRLPGGGYRGLYEPIHGSAPAIAGQGIANPMGTILSVAMMLAWTFGLKAEARALEDAVAEVLEKGPHTADLGGEASTGQVGDAVCARIQAGARL